MTWVIIGVVIIHILFYYSILRINRLKDEKNSICYHTKKDCENCLSFSMCHQQNGIGLIGPKEE